MVLVGTPIGNLSDLSPRAADALASAAVICCEDTRRAAKLLQHAGVSPPRLLVVNQHTEARSVAQVIRLLDEGKRVVVTSDAGMPGISDPGRRLVEAAVDAGARVETVPGPTAMTAALVVSGLATDRFVFEGFLPRKGRDRQERLAAVAAEPRTVVLYEAPHRLARTLADLVETCGGDRQVAVGRELTKLHEEVWRGRLSDSLAWAAGEPAGELVLVLAGAPPAPEADDDAVRAALSEALGSGLSVRDAAAEVAKDLRVPRRRAYQLALDLPTPEA